MRIEFDGPMPLPTPVFYEKHFKSYEEDIEETHNKLNQYLGAPEVTFDAWVDVMGTVIEASQPPEPGASYSTLQHRFLRLSQLGRSFETPVDDQDEQALLGETLKLEDYRIRPYYRNQYAFAQGYLQQQYVIDRMYNGLNFDMTFDAVRIKMNEGLNADINAMIPAEIYNQQVRSIGVVGIAAMGYAQNIVKRWSYEVYPHDTKGHADNRNAFMHGHGVALEGSRMYHSQYNDILVAGMPFNELNPVDIDLSADTTRDTE